MYFYGTHVCLAATIIIIRFYDLLNYFSGVQKVLL